MLGVLLLGIGLGVVIVVLFSVILVVVDDYEIGLVLGVLVVV